jgi:type IV secretory pathway protease TraF
MLGTMIAVTFLAPLGRILHLRISLTDSAAPTGIYRIVRRASVKHGELVAACLPISVWRDRARMGTLTATAFTSA